MDTSHGRKWTFTILGCPASVEIEQFFFFFYLIKDILAKLLIYALSNITSTTERVLKLHHLYSSKFSDIYDWVVRKKFVKVKINNQQPPPKKKGNPADKKKKTHIQKYCTTILDLGEKVKANNNISG